MAKDEKIHSRIVVVRHGETASNREKIFRGLCTVPLNDIGREQARLLGEAIEDVEFGAAYTSPLPRAVETAEIALAGRDVELTEDDRLADFSYGDWTGLSESAVADRWPEEYAQWKKRPHTMRVPGGSTLEEVSRRSVRAMEELARKHNGQTILLFSHRVVNKLLVLGALGLPLDRFPFIRQCNCAYNDFERVPGGYVINAINEAAHLRGKIDLVTFDF